MPLTPRAAFLEPAAAPAGVDAFADSYRLHVARVYAYVVARVGSREEAEDITSETFERALRSSRNVPARGSVDRWLLGIARRTAADHFRRRRPAEALGDQHARSLIDPAAGPEEVSVRREEVRAARVVLASLSDEQRDVLALRLIGELTYPDIAVVVGRSEAAVKKTAYRALMKIREQLAEGETT
jgi:RNA polymerase sigma-70 factor (ECF subfamily)